MKFIFFTFLFLSALITSENKTFALSDYQIKEICHKKSKRYSCIKDLKFKRYQILKGNRIEIPVIKFKK